MLNNLVKFFWHLDHHIIVVSLTSHFSAIGVVFLDDWVVIRKAPLQNLVSFEKESCGSLRLLQSQIIVSNFKLAISSEVVVFCPYDIFKEVISFEKCISRSLIIEFAQPDTFKQLQLSNLHVALNSWKDLILLEVFCLLMAFLSRGLNSFQGVEPSLVPVYLELDFVSDLPVFIWELGLILNIDFGL